MFEKFGQHQPLNRQAERYAKEGVPLIVTEDANTLVGPRVAFGCANAKPVENGCDAAIRLQAREIANQLFGRSASLPTMLSGAVLRDFQ